MFAVFCLVFIRHFEGCLEFFAVSQCLSLYSRISDAFRNDVLLNADREMRSEMLYSVDGRWWSECGCGAMVE